MRIIFIASSLIFLLTGCAKSKTQTPQPTSYKPVTLSDFGACSQSSPCTSIGNSKWVSETWEPQNISTTGSLIVRWSTFSDATCTTYVNEVEATTTLVLGPTVSSAKGATSYKLTPPTSYFVSTVDDQTWNQQGVCGITNWVSDSWQTVSASNPCIGNLVHSVISDTGIMAFTDQLYFGNANNTAIDTTLTLNQSCPMFMPTH